MKVKLLIMRLQESVLKISATFLSAWIIDDVAISRECTTNSDLSKLYDTSSYKPSKSHESPVDHRVKILFTFVDTALLDTTVTSNFLQVSTSQRTSWITTRTSIKKKKWHDVTYIQKLLTRTLQKTKPKRREKKTSNDNNFRILKRWTLRHTYVSYQTYALYHDRFIWTGII